MFRDRTGIAEDFPLEGARSLYGMTKLAGELLVQEYADAYGLRCIINRCGLLTGPWQMAKSDQGVMALWAAAHYFKRPLKYIGFGGTGKQVRDFLHIQDLCDLILHQIDDIDSYTGHVWNVGGGPEFSLSLLEATELCRRISGNTVSIDSDEQNRPADIRIYVTDMTALQSRTDWRPRRNAVQTFEDIFRWIGGLRDERSRADLPPPL